MGKKGVWTQRIVVGELPATDEKIEDTDKQIELLIAQRDRLLFVLQIFTVSTIAAVLLALLFVSPWSAFLLLPPCAALSLFLWFQFQKGA